MLFVMSHCHNEMIEVSGNYADAGIHVKIRYLYTCSPCIIEMLLYYLSQYLMRRHCSLYRIAVSSKMIMLIMISFIFT